MSSTPRTESPNNAAGHTAPPVDNRDLKENLADSRSYQEKLEDYWPWAYYEENPDCWEGDEDYVGRT